MKKRKLKCECGTKGCRTKLTVKPGGEHFFDRITINTKERGLVPLTIHLSIDEVKALHEELLKILIRNGVDC